MTDLTTADLRALHRRAMDLAGTAIAQVTSVDLDRPTPCAEWTLGELLRHMVSENRGFAAAAAGEPAAWDRGDLGDDPFGAYQDSAAAVAKAFAAPDAYDRQVEVREFGVFSGRTAMGMHMIDCLTHGWDVAASIGVSYRPDPELVAAGLAVAARVPDTPKSRGPGAAFDARVPVPGDAPDFERLLGLLGRSPSWTAPC
ncbi:TIGR03086 family metal-binding protein [Nonomuraea rhodomycinica]|uniref:TIGR03086 family protein n=1 Tax=Nonomuraea rhodomycinica TaxID=1712872 RepID=A0A7Y6MCS9_9ACTN|nr:TIGR03086 family metal-binding protein [Nonomuraea rhodomycinica]NUW41884.1 TIGR03086 family protein [Nonomuraea rhodomycinica]